MLADELIDPYGPPTAPQFATHSSGNVTVPRAGKAEEVPRRVECRTRTKRVQSLVTTLSLLPEQSGALGHELERSGTLEAQSKMSNCGWHANHARVPSCAYALRQR